MRGSWTTMLSTLLLLSPQPVHEPNEVVGLDQEGVIVGDVTAVNNGLRAFQPSHALRPTPQLQQCPCCSRHDLCICLVCCLHATGRGH